ncbi:MAG: hypothetical protein ACE5I1_18865, partial [bacterium]
YVFLPWVLGAVRYGEIHTPDDNAIPDKKEIMANISASVRPNIVMRIEGLKEITGYHPMRVHLRLDFAY